jgi:type IV secretory pathway TrbF-like protein
MIGRWIQLTPIKSIGPVALQSPWEQAHQFAPTATKAQIDAYAHDVDALNPEKTTKEAATIEIASMTRRSGKCFRARWKETRFENGHRQVQQGFTANTAAAFLKPTAPRQIQANPIGLMIAEMYVQPDFETAKSSS